MSKDLPGPIGEPVAASAAAGGSIARLLWMAFGAVVTWCMTVFVCWGLLAVFQAMGGDVSWNAWAPLGFLLGAAFVGGAYLYVMHPRPSFPEMLVLYLLGALIAWGFVMVIPAIWAEPPMWSAFVGAHLAAGLVLCYVALRSPSEARRKHVLIALCLPVLFVSTAWVVEYYEFDPWSTETAYTSAVDEREIFLYPEAANGRDAFLMKTVPISSTAGTEYLTTYRVSVIPAEKQDAKLYVWRPHAGSGMRNIDAVPVTNPQERLLVQKAMMEQRGVRDLPWLPRRPIELEGEAVYRLEVDGEGE